MMPAEILETLPRVTPIGNSVNLNNVRAGRKPTRFKNMLPHQPLRSHKLTLVKNGVKQVRSSLPISKSLNNTDHCILLIVSQHEHMSHAHSLTFPVCHLMHVDRLVTVLSARALTKQLSDLVFAKHVSRTCLTWTPNTRVCHNGCGAGGESQRH